MDGIKMKFSVLTSGSKGNSTLVSVSGINILIDAGTNCLYLEQNLKELGFDPGSISYILITHTHVDHISALKVFSKKYDVKIIMTSPMHEELPYVNNYVYIDKFIDINDVRIEVVKLSHDSSDSVSYIVSSNDKSLVYLTDTGYINKKNLKFLKNHSAYIFESNHDIEMLMNSARPHHIKMRILGDKGHLSNEDAASYLNELKGAKTKIVVLAHLSHEANTPEAAIIAHSKLQLPLVIAKQNERTELIEI